MTAHETVLRACGVYKGFVARGGKARTALRDVDLEVRRGEFMCLIGPSGCGKTTVLNMFAGLVQPSDGTILHEGRVVDAVNTRVGYVTQDDNLLPWRSVIGNVELALECKGVPRASEPGTMLAVSVSKGSKNSIRTSSPAECASACRSRGRSSTTACM